MKGGGGRKSNHRTYMHICRLTIELICIYVEPTDKDNSLVKAWRLGQEQGKEGK